MRQISAGRNVAFYFGFLLIILGAGLFVYTMVTYFQKVLNDVGGSVSALDIIRDPQGFQTQLLDGFRTTMVRGFTAAGLIIVGSIIRRIGAFGFAGSGVVLAPQKAREDLEPYSRMAGGMVKDGLDEANLNLGAKPEKVVMIKCRKCGKLNDEDSKFCQECGEKM